MDKKTFKWILFLLAFPMCVTIIMLYVPYEVNSVISADHVIAEMIIPIVMFFAGSIYGMLLETKNSKK